MRSGVRERSAQAVAAADGTTRVRQAPSKSAGHWRAERGRCLEGPWRPGKTAQGRKR